MTRGELSGGQISEYVRQRSRSRTKLYGKTPKDECGFYKEDLSNDKENLERRNQLESSKTFIRPIDTPQTMYSPLSMTGAEISISDYDNINKNIYNEFQNE